MKILKYNENAATGSGTLKGRTKPKFDVTPFFGTLGRLAATLTQFLLSR